jgi:hypothetical protein
VVGSPGCCGRSDRTLEIDAGTFAWFVVTLARKREKGCPKGSTRPRSATPFEAISDLLVQTMIEAVDQDGIGATMQRTIPFEIVTPENF